jgi:beta-glucosidase
MAAAFAGQLLVALLVSFAQSGSAVTLGQTSPASGGSGGGSLRAWPPSALARARAVLAQLSASDKVMLASGNNLNYNHGQDYVGFIEAPAALRATGFGSAIELEDGPQGVADGMTQVTAWPSIMTLSQSWDVDLVRRAAAAMGAEERAKGAHVMLGPAVALVRVPVSGRNFEYVGEEPLLNAVIAAALVEGIQSNNISACVKHFALNSQEYERQGGGSRSSYSAAADERVAHELYFPPYHASVDAGVGYVMCSFNRVNGTYACANDALLNGVLKGRWGFEGTVVSDWGAQHDTVPFANGGLDMEQEWLKNATFYGPSLLAAVQAGNVTAERLDDMALRVLLPLFALGLVDAPIDPATNNKNTNATSAEHNALAREVAEDSLVLLKNSNGLLPFDKAVKRVYVVGDADNTIAGGGSGHVVAPYVVGAAEAIAAVLGGAVQVDVDAELNATEAAVRAAAADVAIVVVAVSSGEGSDRADLSLPAAQNAVASAVMAANPKTVVVVRCPGACLLPWASAAPAIINQLYGGQEAWTAAAEAIFGAINPSGKLTISFPLTGTDTWLSPAGGGPINQAQYPGVQLPGDDFLTATYSEGLLVGWRWFMKTGTLPLFAFGWGLSYAELYTADIEVSGVVSEASNATVTANVYNKPGALMAGREVVQLYVSYGQRGPGEPVRTLRGFAKTPSIAPGESAGVSFTLTARDLSTYDTVSGGWVIYPSGEYSVAVGGNSAILATSSVNVQ